MGEVFWSGVRTGALPSPGEASLQCGACRLHVHRLVSYVHSYWAYISFIWITWVLEHGSTLRTCFSAILVEPRGCENIWMNLAILIVGAVGVLLVSWADGVDPQKLGSLNYSKSLSHSLEARSSGSGVGGPSSLQRLWGDLPASCSLWRPQCFWACVHVAPTSAFVAMWPLSVGLSSNFLCSHW